MDFFYGLTRSTFIWAAPERADRGPLTEPQPVSDDPELEALAEKLDAAAQQRMGRSLSIREIDAGSCNGCELRNQRIE